MAGASRHDWLMSWTAPQVPRTDPPP